MPRRSKGAIASVVRGSKGATHGKPTALATVDGSGLVTATGAGDGEVVVTAALNANRDIAGTRAIAIRNQGRRTRSA